MIQNKEKLPQPLQVPMAGPEGHVVGKGASLK